MNDALSYKPYVVDIDGIKFIIISNNSFYSTNIGFMLRVGSTNDYKGKNGLASMISCLIMNCKYNADKIKDIELSGHNIDYTIDREYSYYSIEIQDESFIKTHIIRLLSILFASKISSTDFEKAKILSISKVYAKQNNTSEWYNDILHESCFLRQTIGKPIQGKIKSIHNIFYDDIICFYKKFYCKRNSVITISTNVDINKIKLIVQECCRKNQDMNLGNGLNSFKKYTFLPKYKKSLRNNNINMFYIGSFQGGIKDYKMKTYVDILCTIFTMTSFRSKGIIHNDIMSQIEFKSFLYSSIGIISIHLSSKIATTNDVDKLFLLTIRDKVLCKDTFQSASNILKNSISAKEYRGYDVAFNFAYHFIYSKKLYKSYIDINMLSVVTFEMFKEFIENIFNKKHTDFICINISSKAGKTLL